jgi:hypothetical protein
MNPDDRPISEWMQPVRPIRVLFQAGDAEHRYYIHIFALRTAGSECEYLSIDGIFIQARSKSACSPRPSLMVIGQESAHD